MFALSLNLGRKTAFVFGSRGVRVSGTWNLNGSSTEEVLNSKLDEIKETCSVREIAIFGSGRQSTGAIVVAAWCRQHNVKLATIDQGDIRLAFTGRKTATAAQMLAEAGRRKLHAENVAEANALATHFYQLEKMAAVA